ncbi:DEAD/DEAH box helicase [Imbroritus primus]|uniref:DEAD/DEAH box helicase n=1 Tax=Imbroritus primus TaxID=3058603 RepID=A0ACD3SV09_9BURK|nr:DEAD/DEAH box helicase [Burkholderiaceae bacterium PBA]
MTQQLNETTQPIVPSPIEKLEAILHAGDTAATAPQATDSPFAALGLNANLQRALAEIDFTQPTEVQAKAIPASLAGRDLLVSSQTGSGKTAAFMLPALQLISEKPAPARPHSDEPVKRMKGKRPRPQPAQPSLLVLTPTRELALQVSNATLQFGKHLRRIFCASILGGMPYPKQLAMLAKMPDILVATPGRLLDHIASGRIDLSKLDMLVFDEADRMLDMGFTDDIDAIVAATPATRQTLMFSATVDGNIARLAARMLRDPQRIEIAAAKVTANNIEQRLHYADDLSHKQQLLDHLLRDVSLKQAIVFTATKRDADSLAERLADTGFSAGALHGDMNQGARNRMLTALRRGNIQVLVATDVAARGIDVPDITHVVNFDLPKQAEDYVHRIGRTGRAGRAGIAINLVNHGEVFQWRRIERFIDRRLDATVIAGLEPKRSAARSAPKGKPRFEGRPGQSRQGRPGGNGGGYGGGRSEGFRGDGFRNDGPRHDGYRADGYRGKPGGRPDGFRGNADNRGNVEGANVNTNPWANTRRNDGGYRGQATGDRYRGDGAGNGFGNRNGDYRGAARPRSNDGFRAGGRSRFNDR